MLLYNMGVRQGRTRTTGGDCAMGEQTDEVEDDANMTRLDQLERAVMKDQPWSREDRAWVIAELREAWARLAEAWIPVDPSRIG